MSKHYKAFENEAKGRLCEIKKSCLFVDTLCPREDANEIYTELANIAGQTEKMSFHLRRLLTTLHLELELSGLAPSYEYLDNPPDTSVTLKEDTIVITMDALLPFHIHGGVFYLHEKLENAILTYRAEQRLQTALFTEKCAVVFFHHYDISTGRKHHIRDFDNLERRCITNVLARHFLVDDSPLNYVSMDILQPDDSAFTEIQIMPIPRFKQLISTLDF